MDLRFVKLNLRNHHNQMFVWEKFVNYVTREFEDNIEKIAKHKLCFPAKKRVTRFMNISQKGHSCD